MVDITTIVCILTISYSLCKRVIKIISFEPFWKTLADKNISTYVLRGKHNISSETIHRLKHNKAITTTKIDDLCFILDCDVEDIIKHVKDDETEYK